MFSLCSALLYNSSKQVLSIGWTAEKQMQEMPEQEQAQHQ
jgi:hypothetical protein